MWQFIRCAAWGPTVLPDLLFRSLQSISIKKKSLSLKPSATLTTVLNITRPGER